MAVAQEARFFRVKHSGPSPVRAGVVESLVVQRRTPLLDEAFEGSKKVVFCWVPSVDTLPGDSTSYFAGSRYFKSPSGELRGAPDMFTLTPSQARRLEERISTALELRNLSNNQ